jgi:tetratricopeptide (TPR) repeat protein
MHFTQPVESLIKGNTDFIGKDLDYTLRAFPNHHRALMSVIRYGERTKLATAPNMPRSIECYLDRAIRFSPDDAISRILYSMFLAKNNRKPEAIQQLDTAASGAEGKENPFTHYNLGLNYFDLKEYEKSEIQAKKAYGMGFKQPTLKENLKSVGKWTEPEADPPTIPAPAASN